MTTLSSSCARALRVFAFSLVLLPLLASAADPDVDAANQAYANQQFERAAGLFSQIIASRGYSAALCYNLANAEMKAGHVGQAILNYERARYLAPTDSDIDHNLQLARKLAGLEPNSYRWWEIALRDINLSVWLAVMGLVLVLLFIAILGSANMPAIAAATKLPPRILRNIFRGILFAGIPLCLLLGYIELVTVGFNNRIEGVVVAPKDAILRLSPFDSSESTGTIPEGELVTVEERHDDYIRVEARDHHFGWIRISDLAPVVAGSFDASPPN
jgi:hypothetical protein